ncbi:MAG: M20/M25/M40 family metallo-hydrolase [Loktanella sp.]|nr:M20/M25/M40 family metallo-hydrolase [Loktanella sp.]
MPIKNRLAERHDLVTAWRRDLHENPELMYDTHRTSGIVAEKLCAFGCDEVVERIGRTGVVGVIKGRTDTRGHVVGLRADMDACRISGNGAVDDNTTAIMGGEDFAYMLKVVPGAYIQIGNGDTAEVHHPLYNFNDEAIPAGASYWAELVENRMLVASGGKE